MPHDGFYETLELGRIVDDLKAVVERAEAGDLPQEAEHRGVAGGQAEHHPHHRLDTVEAVAGGGQAPLETPGHLGGAVVHHRLEQRILGGEPVEDRLLAYVEEAGEIVEGRGLEAAGPELRHGHGEDAIGGLPSFPRGHLPDGRQMR